MNPEKRVQYMFVVCRLLWLGVFNLMFLVSRLFLTCVSIESIDLHFSWTWMISRGSILLVEDFRMIHDGSKRLLSFLRQARGLMVFVSSWEATDMVDLLRKSVVVVVSTV